MTNQYKVAILMATYNGEKFLMQQLESIKNQTYKNWCLYVLDDGSIDTTWDILKKFQTETGSEKVKIFKQQNHGACITFLRLVSNPDINADYYAYSDQDDIWDNDKIEKAIKVLEKINFLQPQFYCSNARLINKENQIIGSLLLRCRALSFQNALVQNISPGNTMVFNHSAKNILQAAGIVNIELHDRWTYLVVSGCGGFLYYDPVYSISYRIHGENLVGFIDNYLKRYLFSLKRVLRSDFSKNNRQHIDAINKIYDKLTPEAKKSFNFFVKACQGNVMKRIYYLYKSRVYCQEITGTLGIYFAQLFGKF